MATFAYKARRLDGSSVTGSLPAENERAVLLALDRLGLYPIAIDSEQVAQPSDKKTLSSWLPARISRETGARFARELADLVQAGVPILKALDTLSDTPVQGEGVIWGAREAKDDGRARSILREVQRQVAQGAPLAQALEQRPELFGATSTSMIRAGEAGGFLDASLRRVAVFAERETALTRKVRGALIYPALLLTLSAGAIAFLLAWVVPRFAVIYDDLGGALPAPTRVLMSLGEALQTYWYLLALALGAGVWWLLRSLQTEEGLLWRDRILLRIPLIRSVIAQAAIARFCRTLGTLLGSGVPILQALEIGKDAAGNREFSQRLALTLAPLREGADLATPLRATRLFPPQVLEMLEVGQESGTLVEVLERAGERADEEVDQALRAFVTVFEPMLIVAVAGVVFFVVVAALLPVFTLNTLVH